MGHQVNKSRGQIQLNFQTYTKKLKKYPEVVFTFKGLVEIDGILARELRLGGTIKVDILSSEIQYKNRKDIYEIKQSKRFISKNVKPRGFLLITASVLLSEAWQTCGDPV